MLGLDERSRLLRRGRRLEATTLGWNVAGIVALAIATVQARSVALFGFGLDSLIEIGASTVVLWELADTAHDRQARALRLIGWAFVALAAYLAVQSTVVLAVGYRSHHNLLGIIWTALTAAVMFALAAAKARTGALLNNPVLQTEGRVTTMTRSWRASFWPVLVLHTAPWAGGGPIPSPATYWSSTRSGRLRARSSIDRRRPVWAYNDRPCAPGRARPRHRMDQLPAPNRHLKRTRSGNWCRSPLTSGNTNRDSVPRLHRARSHFRFRTRRVAAGSPSMPILSDGWRTDVR